MAQPTDMRCMCAFSILRIFDSFAFCNFYLSVSYLSYICLDIFYTIKSVRYNNRSLSDVFFYYKSDFCDCEFGRKSLEGSGTQDELIKIFHVILMINLCLSSGAHPNRDPDINFDLRNARGFNNGRFVRWQLS